MRPTYGWYLQPSQRSITGFDVSHDGLKMKIALRRVDPRIRADGGTPASAVRQKLRDPAWVWLIVNRMRLGRA